MVGEHNRVGPDETEQLAEEERWSDPRRPAHARMSDEGDAGVFLYEPAEVRKAGDHRRDHDGVDASCRRGGELAAHAVEIAGEARQVAGALSCPLDAAQ